MDQSLNEVQDLTEPIFRVQQPRKNSMINSWNVPFNFGSPNHDQGVSKSADFGKMKLNGSPSMNKATNQPPTSPFKL